MKRGLFFGVLLVLAATAQSGRAQAVQTTPDRRLDHLHHGINISNWFSLFPDGKTFTREQFETAITPRDLDLIRDMGFDHVRLCVDPQPMFRPHDSDRIDSEFLTDLDAALQMILSRGLAVEIDIQAGDAFKQELATDDIAVERFADFWRALARHYSSLDPDRVFFEALNEPAFPDSYRWYGILAKLVAAIRSGAPDHTIIVTGGHWSDDDDLVFLEPLRDANVLYTFHFYQPQIFTHQGANWSVNFWRSLSGVPYPSNPEGADHAASKLTDAVHRLTVERYGMSEWNGSRIELEIGEVTRWAKSRGVTVICNEFGVYRAAADPRDRARWLADVRTSLERHGIGWTMWDYSGGFGVVTKTKGDAVPDETTVGALGLRMPARATESSSR